jgi:lysozyme
MKTSAKGIAVIKKWESCKLKAYLCPAGVWTIGYGHTQGVKEGDTCTQEEAESFLRFDLGYYEGFVNVHFKNVSQNQYDALVSLCYNIGPGNLRKSRVFEAVRTNPSDIAIRGYFLKHVYANGTRNGKDDDKDGLIDEPGEFQMLPGLVKRRNDEIALYFS